MANFSERVAYVLPSNTREAISQLADVLDIPMPELEGDSTSTLQAMCGTILYRHLDSKEQIEVMRLIERQHPRVAMRLRALALHVTYVNPDWGVWSLSGEEIEAAIAGHEKFQRMSTVLSMNPGHLASARGVWSIVANGATRTNVATLAAGLIMLGITEMSAAHLDKLRQERLNRLKPANENSDY